MAGQPAAHHDVDVVAVPHKLIATWPVGTFLENIAILPGGDFVISAHNRKELHRATSGGEHYRWVSMPASPAGMITSEAGVFVVAGEPGVDRIVCTTWRCPVRSRSGPQSRIPCSSTDSLPVRPESGMRSTRSLGR